MKISNSPAIFLLILFSFSGCSVDEPVSETAQHLIFPKGELAPAEYFTGNAWVRGLVADDSTYTTAIGNVVFEPSARSYWHSHPSGQILIVTEGKGYHQIKGEPKQVIRKGDVVKCPPDVVHWHGASKDSSMTHIYIVPNTENGIVEWLGKVTDEEYRNVK